MGKEGSLGLLHVTSCSETKEVAVQGCASTRSRGHF